MEETVVPGRKTDLGRATTALPHADTRNRIQTSVVALHLLLQMEELLGQAGLSDSLAQSIICK